MKKKILVFGGKRILGSSIVKQLSLNNVVYCVCRTPPKKKIYNVNYIHGNLENSNFLFSLSRSEYDIIIDNLAYDELHVRKVHDAFKDKGIRYIMTSSYWVNKLKKLKKPISKTTFDYILEKAKAEKAASEVWDDCIIVRLPILFGKNDHTGRLKSVVKKLVENQDIILDSKRSNKFRIAYVDDVAKVYELLCSTKKKQNSLLVNLANPEIYTPKKFYMLCANFLGISNVNFIKGDNYPKEEQLFRDIDYVLDCRKLYKIFPDIKFSKNWLKKLCLYELKKLKEDKNISKNST